MSKFKIGDKVKVAPTVVWNNADDYLFNYKTLVYRGGIVTGRTVDSGEIDIYLVTFPDPVWAWKGASSFSWDKVKATPDNTTLKFGEYALNLSTPESLWDIV